MKIKLNDINKTIEIPDNYTQEQINDIVDDVYSRFRSDSTGVDNYDDVSGDNIFPINTPVEKQEKNEEKGFWDDFSVTKDVLDPLGDMAESVGAGAINAVGYSVGYAGEKLGDLAGFLGMDSLSNVYHKGAEKWNDATKELAEGVATINGKNEFYEAFQDADEEDIPIAGTFYTADKLYDVNNAVDNIISGSYTQEDIKIANDYIEELKEKEKKRESSSYVFGEGIKNTLTFGAELLATGGVGALAKKGTVGAGIKTTEKLIEKKLNKVFTKELEKQLVKQKLKGNLVKHSVSASLFTGMHTPEGTLERMLPKYEMKDGQLIIKEEGQPVSEALKNAVSENLTTYVSEFSGGVYAGVWNKLPKGIKDGITSNAVSNMLKKSFPKLSDNIIGKMVKKVGWDGFFGEFMEEQHEKWINAILAEAGLGDQEWQPYTAKELTQTIMSVGALSAVMKKAPEEVGKDKEIQDTVLKSAKKDLDTLKKSLKQEKADKIKDALIQNGFDEETADAMVANAILENTIEEKDNIEKQVKEKEKEIEKETPEEMAERLTKAGKEYDEIIDAVKESKDLELEDATKIAFEAQNKVQELENIAKEDDFSDIEEEFNKTTTKFDENSELEEEFSDIDDVRKEEIATQGNYKTEEELKYYLKNSKHNKGLVDISTIQRKLMIGKSQATKIYNDLQNKGYILSEKDQEKEYAKRRQEKKDRKKRLNDMVDAFNGKRPEEDQVKSSEDTGDKEKKSNLKDKKQVKKQNNEQKEENNNKLEKIEHKKDFNDFDVKPNNDLSESDKKELLNTLIALRNILPKFSSGNHFAKMIEASGSIRDFPTYTKNGKLVKLLRDTGVGDINFTALGKMFGAEYTGAEDFYNQWKENNFGKLTQLRLNEDTTNKSNSDSDNNAVETKQKLDIIKEVDGVKIKTPTEKTIYKQDLLKGKYDGKDYITNKFILEFYTTKLEATEDEEVDSNIIKEKIFDRVKRNKPAEFTGYAITAPFSTGIELKSGDISHYIHIDYYNYLVKKYGGDIEFKISEGITPVSVEKDGEIIATVMPLDITSEDGDKILIKKQNENTKTNTKPTGESESIPNTSKGGTKTGDRVGENKSGTDTKVGKSDIRDGNADVRDDTSGGDELKEEPKTLKSRQTANERAIEILEDKKYSTNRDDYTSEEIADLELYTGEGGFGRDANKEGTYNEYYTGQELVKKVVDLARGYVKFKDVLEPSVGTGNFVKQLKDNNIDAYEFQKVSGTIAKILHPNINIKIGNGIDGENNIGDFQSMFYDAKNNKPKKITKKYDAVVGNPPFGARKNFYTGLGEERSIKRWEDYFVKRGLDVLKDNGVLSYVLSTSFINQANNLDKIAKLGKLVDAYRLPEGMFSGTEIPTDIVVFKKKPTTDREEIEKRKEEIKNWFKNNPDKVLGEITTKSGRFGAVETVKTDLAPEDVLKKITPKEESTIILKEVEETTPTGKKTTVRKVRIDTKKEVKEKTKRDKKVAEKAKGNVKTFTSPEFESLDSVEKDLLLEASKNKDKIVEYSEEKEPYIAYDPEIEAWVPNKWYYTGNVVEKYNKLAGSSNKMDRDILDKQMAEFEKILPEHKSFDEISISWRDEDFKNKTITVDDIEMTVGSLFAGWKGFLSDAEYYLPMGVNRWDLEKMFNGDKMDKGKKAYKKEISNTLDLVWNRFLKTLPEYFKQEYAEEYNDKLNNYIHPNYNYLPVEIEGVADTLENGNEFTPLPAQRHGISFLVNKMKGLIAYGVGVGKTYTMILSVKAQMDRGLSKRPLFIVPKPTLKNTWEKSINEILPNVNVVNLGGLTTGDVARLKKELGNDPSKWIKDGDMVLITKEGVTRLGVNTGEDSFFSKVARDYVKVSYFDKDPKVLKGKDSEFLGEVKGMPEYDFEKMGFDLLAVDEVHNFRKALGTPQKIEKGGKKAYNIQGTTTNARSKKLFALTRYIQNKHNGNVFLASATPFENNPLEVYSILNYIGYDELQKAGITNANAFFDRFANFTYSLEVDSKNELVDKEVMKSFSNVTELQTVLTSLMDYKEDPTLIRPEKKVNTPILQMSDAQNANRAIIEKQANGTDKGAVLKAIGMAEQNTMSPFLLDYTDYEDEKGEEIKIKLDSKNTIKVNIDVDKVIEDSPKVKYLIDSIKELKKSKKDGKGTFAYFGKVGIDKGLVEIVEKYLIKNKILKKEEIVKITGSVNDDKKAKAMDEFNSGKAKLLLGSETASEGIDLQKNSAHTVVLAIEWNPTTMKQVEGRSWRQGNPMEIHNISYPLLENSLDALKFSKFSEKAGRINSIFSNIKEDGDMFNYEEVDPDEQKIALITDIQSKTSAYINLEKKKIDTEIAKYSDLSGRLKDKLFSLKQSEKDIESIKRDIKYEVERLENVKKYVANNNEYGYTQEDIDEKEKTIKTLEKKLNVAEKLYENKKQELEDKEGIDVKAILEKIKELEVKVVELDEKKKELDSEENREKVYNKFKKEYEATLAKRVKPEEYVKNIVEDIEVAKEFTKEELDKMKIDKMIELGYLSEDKRPTSKKPAKTKQDEVVEKQEKKKNKKPAKKKTTTKKSTSNKTSKPKLSKVETGIFDIITNNELTAEEKVDALLNRKQENKEFKDYGERVSGSKKENAMVRLVLKYGDKQTIEELTKELGYETMIKQLDGKKILEETLPENFNLIEKAKGNKENILLTNAKKLLLDSVLKTPKLFVKEKEWGRSMSRLLFSLREDSKHYNDWINRYNVVASEMPLSDKEEAVKEFIANYKDFVEEIVKDIVNAKDAEDLKKIRNKNFKSENFEFAVSTVLNYNNFKYGWNSLVKTKPFKINPHIDALSNIKDIEDAIKYNNDKMIDDGVVIKIREPHYKLGEKPSYRDLLDYFNDFSTYNIDKKDYDKDELAEIGENNKKAVESFNKALKLLNNYDIIPEQTRSESNITDKSHGNFEEIAEYDVKEDRYSKEFISSENLSKVFGFKSVQLGNYMDDKSSKEHILQTMGAVEDMSEVMGIDLPKIINEKGLSIAFGARGGSKALAHYEPSKNIINLTKKRGDGSFGHEFGHFLDHKFGEISSKYKKNQRRYRISEENEFLLMNEIMDTYREEYVEKTFEPKPSASDIASNVVELVNDLIKKGGDLQELIKKHRRIGAEIAQEYANQTAKPITVKVKERVPTYLESVIKFTGKENSYWTKKTEMFARAFQAYLEDKMNEKGIKNSYVTHPTDHPVYPQGEQRKAINKRFDALFVKLAGKPDDSILKYRIESGKEYLEQNNKNIETLKDRKDNVLVKDFAVSGIKDEKEAVKTYRDAFRDIKKLEDEIGKDTVDNLLNYLSYNEPTTKDGVISIDEWVKEVENYSENSKIVDKKSIAERLHKIQNRIIDSVKFFAKQDSENNNTDGISKYVLDENADWDDIERRILNISNRFYNQINEDLSINDRIEEYKKRNKEIESNIKELEKELENLTDNKKRFVFSEPRFKESTEYGDLGYDFLKDFQKRHKVKFDVHWVDTILTQAGEKAFGIYYDGSIALRKGLGKTTVPAHEIVHLTLANLDKLPKFNQWTREELLKEQAKLMGIEFTEENAVKIEEALAVNLERYIYQNKTVASSKLRKFLHKLWRRIQQLVNLVRNHNDVIRDFYDEIAFGEYTYGKEVEIENNSIVDNLISMVDGKVVLLEAGMGKMKATQNYSPAVQQLEETYEEQQIRYDNATSKTVKKQLDKSLGILAEKISKLKQKEDMEKMMFKIEEEKQFINTKDKFNKLNIKLHKVESTITQKIAELNDSMVGRLDTKSNIDMLKAYNKLDRMRYQKGANKGKFTEKGLEFIEKLGVSVEEAEKNIKEVAKLKAQLDELKKQSILLREQIAELKKTDKGLKKKVSETKRRMAFISQKLNVLKDNINKAKTFKNDYTKDERRVMAQTAIKLAKIANKSDIDLLEKAFELERVDIYKMNSEEFYNYLDELTKLSNTAIEKYFTYQEIQQLIAKKRLERVSQISLNLFGKSDFRKLSKKDMEKLKSFLENVRDGERFLPNTLMQKLSIYKNEKGYEKMKLITERELLEETGLDLSTIYGNKTLNEFVGGWVFQNKGEFEKFLFDAIVKVNAVAKSNHEARMEIIAPAVNNARKSRNDVEGWWHRAKTLIAKHDSKLAEYLQSPPKEIWETLDENIKPARYREQVEEDLTPEELKIGDKLIDVYNEHLEYLSQYGLKSRFSNWYMPQKQEGIAEAVLWNHKELKLKESLGKIILSNEEEKKMADIFINNGEQVAYWKFFNHMMKRSGGTTPSLDVLETFRTYDLAIEKKKELDKIVPLISGVVNIAKSQNKEQGSMLEQKVIKEFLNDLKGRKVIDKLVPQGSKRDRFLQDTSSWFYFKTLSFGLIFNSVNAFGAVAGGVAQMHELKHWKQFLKNLKYMFSYDVWKNIEGFAPESPLSSWMKSGKTINDFVSIWGYSGMAMADTLSKRMVYLSRLSEEEIAEIEAGAINNVFDTLSEIDAELSQFLQTETSKSMLGKTGTMRELKTFKGWAIPTLIYTSDRLITILRHSINAIAKKDIKKFDKQDWIAVKQISILMTYTWAVSSILSSIGDCEGEDKHSLKCQFFSKAQRDADLFWQAITLPSVFFMNEKDRNRYNDVYHWAVPKLAYLTDAIHHIQMAFAGEKMAGTDINAGLLELRNDITPIAIQQFTGREGWWSVRDEYIDNLIKGKITEEEYAKYKNDNYAERVNGKKLWDEMTQESKDKAITKVKQRKVLYKKFGYDDVELFYDRYSRVSTNSGRASQLTLDSEIDRLKPIIEFIRDHRYFKKQLKSGKYTNTLIKDNLYKMIKERWAESKKEQSK